MTDFPVMRPVVKSGLKLNFISIRDIPAELLESRKTEAGNLHVSNPILTACDLIQFEKRIGGLIRAVTVLGELAEELRSDHFTPVLLQHVPATTLQRLGYMLEVVLRRRNLADDLFQLMQQSNLHLFRIPLKSSGRKQGYSSVNRWKVIVNMEFDEME